MAKFNVKKFVKTYEGAKAIKLPDKTELVKLCLTSFLENTFYETKEDVMERVISYSKAVDQDFLLKLAIFSRDYGLRSINHLLAALYIVNNSGKQGIRTKYTSFLKKLVKRPDEMAEILGAFNSLIESDKTIVPNVLKVGFKELLETKFDKYQLQKYKNKGDFKIHDIVNLVHANNENINLLMKGEIGTAETRESKLSAGEDKGETFEALMKENKLGTKALLMNIKNIIEGGVDYDLLVEYINKANLKGIFPFDAMKAIRGASEAHATRKVDNKVMIALESLAVSTFGNLPLEGKVAVICDTSGSMTSCRISDKSQFRPIDVAAFYTALAYVQGGDTGAFCFDTQARQIKTIPGDGVGRIFKSIVDMANGGGTYVQSAIDLVKDRYDTAIIFTDGQFANDIRNTGKLKQIIIANLMGYKNTNMTKGNIIEISGFNDTMLKYASDLRNIKGLVETIEKIEL